MDTDNTYREPVSVAQQQQRVDVGQQTTCLLRVSVFAKCQRFIEQDNYTPL
jgi:hypothetical protein